MGARIRALNVIAVLGLGGACAPWPRASVAAVPADTRGLAAGEQTAPDTASADAALVLPDAPAEEMLDAETLWALDELLEDPVDLNRGALERLLALPWLTRTHLDRIVRARPLPDREALGRLPGWDAALAQRVAPFVHVGPRRDSWSAGLRARVTRAAPVLTLRLESGAMTSGLRSARDTLALDGGFVRFDLHPVRVLAGDFGFAHGQGLLWWGSASALQATSAPLRQARGTFGIAGGGRSQALRGVAGELLLPRLQLACVGGDGRTGRVRGAAATLAVRRGLGMSCTWLQAAGRNWYGGGCTMTSATSQAAVEVVPFTHDAAIAVAGATRRGRTRLGARWQHTPMRALGPQSGIAAGERERDVRTALVHAATRWARVAWDMGLVQSTRDDTLGGRTTNIEQRLSARWSSGVHALEVRLRQRRTHTQALETEALAATATVRSRGLVVRYERTLGGRTRVGVDYRAEERAQGLAVQSGSAWQVHLAHATAGLETQAAVTSFSAPEAGAAPVVPEAGGTSRRLVGDGVRGAVGLRLRALALDCSVRGACSVGAAQPPRPEWSASIGLSLP